MIEIRDVVKLNERYKDNVSLSMRVNFFKQFSSATVKWTEWIYDAIEVGENENILEIGCGNGDMWIDNKHKLPGNINITLSDYSREMVEETSKKLGSIDKFKNINVIRMDARNIQFESNTFDKVIANHVLNHFDDIHVVLQEIIRVLKPTGTFFCTTTSNHTMNEFHTLMNDFCPELDYPRINSEDNGFSLENGKKQLSEYFESIVSKKYFNNLIITNPEIAIDYILSYHNISNRPEHLNKTLVVKEFTQFFYKNCKKRKLESKQINGIFICKKPLKYGGS